MAELLPPLRFTPPTRRGTAMPTGGVGRPETPQERLLVRGNPQAEVRRAEVAPGRIPVNAPTTQSNDDKPLALDKHTMQREVESSEEYQLLSRAGLIKGKEAKTPPPETQERTTQKAPELDMEAQSSLAIEVPSSSRKLAEEQAQRKSDPLAFDLDGNGLQTSGIEKGALFDINADGKLDRTSFVSGGDAFLALDRNGNGRIDDGRELFGDQNGDANGYLALAHYDDNGDGIINRNDAIFQQLRLFSLAAGGSQQLRSLEEEGIASITLNYNDTNKVLNAYDSIAQQSTFQRSDGSVGESADLLLGYETLE